MNKFKLRHLRNEKKNIEKKLKNINKEIAKEENVEVLLDGEFTLARNMKVFESNGVKPMNNSIECKITIVKYGDEIVCKLRGRNEYLNNKVFVGKANCAYDDCFDPSIGCLIAESRATQQIFKYIEEQMSK